MSPTLRLAASTVGINRTYLSKLEKGSYPGWRSLQKLATVLEVEPADLLRGGPSTTKRNCSEQPPAGARLPAP